MKIKYLTEKYFQAVDIKTSSKEDVMTRVSKILKQNQLEEKINHIDTVRLTSATIALLKNITKAKYDGISDYGYYSGKDFFVSSYKDEHFLSLEPIVHNKTKSFYKEFNAIGEKIPGESDGKYPFKLKLVNSDAVKTKKEIVINLEYICMPCIDIQMFSIWKDVFYNKYKKDLIYDDIPEELTDDAIVKMAGGPGSKVIIDFLRNNREYKIDDLFNCGWDYELTKKLVLDNNVLSGLKEDINVLEKYISECIDDIPITINLYYIYRTDPYNTNKPKPDPIKIL